MSFNTKKCKVMHMGKNSPNHHFVMGGQILDSIEEERDIGVTVSSDLKPSAHCAKAARTTQAVLGQISRAFNYRDRHVFVRLYKQYVRPHLEFCTQAWSPWSVAIKAALEKLESPEKGGGHSIWTKIPRVRGQAEGAGPTDPGGEATPGRHAQEASWTIKHGSKRELTVAEPRGRQQTRSM